MKIFIDKIDEHNRIIELKQLKKMANEFLEYHSNEIKQKDKKWERSHLNRKIVLLRDIIRRLNKLLHPKEVEAFSNASNNNITFPQLFENRSREEIKSFFENYGTISSQGVEFFFLMEISHCSPYIRNVDDLSWFHHGTVGEHIEYALGRVDETVFEKYLPYQIQLLEKKLNLFLTNHTYKEDLVLLDSTINLIKKEEYIAANILIITLIEGLVRKFCSVVYKNQNPELSPLEVEELIYSVKYSSFESLICSSIWKNDIPIHFTKVLNKYSQVERPVIIETERKLKRHKEAYQKILDSNEKLSLFVNQQLTNKNLSDKEISDMALQILDEGRSKLGNIMSEEDKNVMIGLDVYLHFLVKKIKDDRNNIIHGKYSLFKEKWRSLIYLTALGELMDKILWYEKNVITKSN